MEERRKQPRKDLMSYSQVFNLDDGKLIGYLGDLGLSGAMVIGDNSMDVNTQLNVSIQLPELPRIKETRLIVPVRVAHCHPDLSPAYFNIGLAFDVINDEQKAIINAVIENYEFRRQTPDYSPTSSELEE